MEVAFCWPALACLPARADVLRGEEIGPTPCMAFLQPSNRYHCPGVMLGFADDEPASLGDRRKEFIPGAVLVAFLRSKKVRQGDGRGDLRGFIQRGQAVIHRRDTRRLT